MKAYISAAVLAFFLISGEGAFAQSKTNQKPARQSNRTLPDDAIYRTNKGDDPTHKRSEISEPYRIMDENENRGTNATLNGYDPAWSEPVNPPWEEQSGVMPPDSVRTRSRDAAAPAQDPNAQPAGQRSTPPRE